MIMKSSPDGELRNDLIKAELIKTACYFCDAILDNNLFAAEDRLAETVETFNHLKAKRKDEQSVKHLQEWQDYLHSILDDNQINQLLIALRDDRPIIIDGPQGPTGKTALCTLLKNLNVEASEAWDLQQYQEQAYQRAVRLELGKRLSPDKQAKEPIPLYLFENVIDQWYRNWLSQSIASQDLSRE